MKVGVTILLLAVVLCGCGKTEQRFNDLEEANTELKNDVHKLQVTLDDMVAAAKFKDQAAAARNARMLAELDRQLEAKLANVDSIIAARIESTIGTKAEMSGIVEDVLDETLQEREMRATEERQAQQEERQRQWRERAAGMEQRRVDKAAENLGLSDEQKEAYAQAQSATRENMRDLMKQMREDGSFNMQDFSSKIKQQDEENMRKILNEEQFKSYQEQQDAQFGWVHRMFGGRGTDRTEQ